MKHPPKIKFSELNQTTRQNIVAIFFKLLMTKNIENFERFTKEAEEIKANFSDVLKNRTFIKARTSDDGQLEICYSYGNFYLEWEQFAEVFLREISMNPIKGAPLHKMIQLAVELKITDQIREPIWTYDQLEFHRNIQDHPWKFQAPVRITDPYAVIETLKKEGYITREKDKEMRIKTAFSSDNIKCYAEQALACFAEDFLRQLQENADVLTEFFLQRLVRAQETEKKNQLIGKMMDLLTEEGFLIEGKEKGIYQVYVGSKPLSGVIKIIKD